MPILIINHDAVFLTELQTAFEQRGYRVIASNNSIAAVQLFFQHKPKLVILNIAMPNKDGFEIVREIRCVCEKTFILAVSANSFYLRAIKKLGANLALPISVRTKFIVDIVQLIHASTAAESLTGVALQAGE
jgi:DNA-binding response OmpR family regulator